jgi:hypothetical protein
LATAVLPGVDGVVEVVGRLGAGEVVQRHPVLGAHRLGGDEAAVARPEPALGGAVPVVVHPGTAGVVDVTVNVAPFRMVRAGRDDELVGRALVAVLRVPGDASVE